MNRHVQRHSDNFLLKGIFSESAPIRLFWRPTILLLYIALTVFTAIHHEPWRDEAQAWLIARDLPLLKWFWQMSYEGSPGLWHLILMPFARMGAPYEIEHIIHLLIAYVAVAIFLYRAPFSFYLKILFVFGFYMSFEYAIIARSYNLSILFLFLLATFYSTRFTHPLRHAILLALLMNTNVHSFFFGLSIFAGYLYECYRDKAFDNQRMIAICIVILATLLVVLQLLPESDNPFQKLIRHQNYNMIFLSLQNAFLPHVAGFGIIMKVYKLVISVLLALTACHLYKNERVILFVFIASYVALFYVFVFKYSGSTRHHGLLLMMFLSVLWMGYPVNKKKPEKEKLLGEKSKQKKWLNKKWKLPNHFALKCGKLHATGWFKTCNWVVQYIQFHKWAELLVTVCLLISISSSKFFHQNSWNHVLSGARHMAQYIKDQNLDRKTIVAHQSPHASALLPYLPGVQFWYADIEDFATYVTWNVRWDKNSEISFVEVEKRIARNNLPKKELLLLLTDPIPEKVALNYQLLYSSDKKIHVYGTEKFYLYKKL